MKLKMEKDKMKTPQQKRNEVEKEIEDTIKNIEKKWYKLEETKYEGADSVPFDELLNIVRKVLSKRLIK